MKIEYAQVWEKLIEHCPWNPRPTITPESVADLAASIKAKGLLQDIGLMRIPGSGPRDEKTYWCLFGNRRLEACRVVGMRDIPCKVYDCMEREGRELTRIENEQRLGVSPLEDAKLIQSLMDMGLSQSDIASHFGVSNAMVCRRAKLLSLDKRYHELEHKLSANALEQIAMFPDSIQKRALKGVQSYAMGCSSQLQWPAISRIFSEEMRNLDSCPWCKDWKFAVEWQRKKCVNCPKRTGSQPDLWGDLAHGTGGGERGLGSCLDKKCYYDEMAVWLGEVVKTTVSTKAIGSSRIVNSWQLPEGTTKPNKVNNWAYWYYDEYSSDKPLKVVYAPSPSEFKRREEVAKAKRESEQAAAKAERELLSSARAKIDEYLDNESDANSEKLVSLILDWLSQPESKAGRQWLMDQITDSLGSQGWGSTSNNMNAEFVQYTGGLYGKLTEDERKKIVSLYDFEEPSESEDGDDSCEQDNEQE